VSEARQPIFRYDGCTSSPGVPAGTRIVLISGRSPPLVRAATTITEVISVPELVMNAFWPSSTHSPAGSSSTARVRMAAASLPPSGSVRPKRGQRPPGQQVGEPRLALLFGAEPEDRPRPETQVHRQGDGHRLVDPSQLLEGDADRGEVGARPAVLLGEGQAEEPQIAHGPDRIEGEGGRAVPLLGVRGDLAFGEVAHHGPELLVLGGQLDGHRLMVRLPTGEPVERGPTAPS
jgi:hypothetical protein